MLLLSLAFSEPAVHMSSVARTPMRSASYDYGLVIWSIVPGGTLETQWATIYLRAPGLPGECVTVTARCSLASHIQITPAEIPNQPFWSAR